MIEETPETIGEAEEFDMRRFDKVGLTASCCHYIIHRDNLKSLLEAAPKTGLTRSERCCIEMEIFTMDNMVCALRKTLDAIKKWEEEEDAKEERE